MHGTVLPLEDQSLLTTGKIRLSGKRRRFFGNGKSGLLKKDGEPRRETVHISEGFKKKKKWGRPLPPQRYKKEIPHKSSTFSPQFGDLPLL